MAKGIIDIILDQIFDAEWKGRRGEKLTERELNLVKLFGRDGKVLRNVYIPKDNGETSEIDVLFITQKGIFVIESKNYSGWIFGSESDTYWAVSLPNGTKNRFYNPVLQNQSHIRWLRQYLADNTPLFSIIVFSERCKLKNVKVSNNDVYVLKRDRLYASIREIWETSEDVLSVNDIKHLYSRLKSLTDVDEATKETHVASIKSHYPTKKQSSYKSTITEAAKRSDDLVLVCPKCNAQLILRTAKKGPNAGTKFYGCSNFPKCRFTKEA